MNCIDLILKKKTTFSFLIIRSFFLSILLLATVCSQSAYSLADLREYSTLREWKDEASKSSDGKKLIALLDKSNRSLKHNSTDKVALFKRGYLYGVIGCTQSAIVDLSKAINIDPYFARAYGERGICYLDLKDYKHALLDLNQALSLNSWSGDARLARGRLLLNLNKPHLAERDLKACSNQTTKFLPALPGELSANHYNAVSYYLGKVYERIGRRFDAVREYRKYEKTSHVSARGWLHRYADKPSDANVLVKKLTYRL